ncbi:MAG TPA: CARDB domain-containing protein [Solirubrobacterales bacterium]|nr:CARDB domain-containing protein [Solirubrobacterales bacterium]
MRKLGWSTMLALVALATALWVASPAPSAPGDIADLSVTKTDSPDPVTVGGTLTYTVTVTNLGPQEATNVVLDDRMPPQSDLVSATSSVGKCEDKGTRVTCQLGKLAKDATATVTIVVRPTKTGTIDNTASVDSVETDPIPINDSATASTRVTAASTCRGVPATIVGTPGSDRLVGTGGPDVIAGLGGGDTVISEAGRDLVCSGGGNDRVVAGPALDRVFGGAGADRLLGRGGPDLLAGNPGRDVLKGNAGGDRLRGGGGFDRCIGGGGFDRERACER